MNIMFFDTIEEDIFGGVEKWMGMVADGLIRRGHTMYLAGRKDSEFLRLSGSTNPAINIFELDISGDFNPATINLISKFLKENKIEIIVANFNKAVRLGGLASKLGTNTKLIWRVGLNLTKNKFIHRWLTPKLISGVISPSQALKDQIVSSGYITEAMVRVIPTGINEIETKISKTEARAKLLKKYQLPENAVISVTSGRFVNQKGHVFLIEAAKEIVKKYDNVRFLLVGNGQLEEMLKEKIKENQLENNFVFCGFLDNYDLEFLGADFMTHPSIEEPFGIALLEGMRAELPVIASRVGGIPEVVTENETALLIEPERPELIARAIISFLDDPATMKKIGRAGFERWKNQFKYDIMVERVEHYIKEVMSC